VAFVLFVCSSNLQKGKFLLQIYASRIWVLKESMKRKLLLTERMILGRRFGPTTDSDGTLRIKTNDELNNPIRNKNISNHNMTQRLSWFGHVHRRTNDRMVKKTIRVEKDIYKIGRKTRYEMGKGYQKRFKNYENK
jgi:hypothetical protein